MLVINASALKDIMIKIALLIIVLLESIIRVKMEPLVQLWLLIIVVHVLWAIMESIVPRTTVITQFVDLMLVVALPSLMIINVRAWPDTQVVIALLS